MDLHPARVIAAIPADARIIRVGLSGGVDSVVLVHILAHHLVPGRCLEAVHVHHGLHPDADDWAWHCRRLCANLGVPCRVQHVCVEAGAGAGLEAAARDLRYRALCDGLSGDDVLVTAHHADDQAETVLLQLLRGAGVRGLAAMARDGTAPGAPHIRLVRPLLDTTRDAIESYARAEGLDWVEDPANVASVFDRSYLRREVMPRLRARWPGIATTVARSAGLCAEATAILDEVAAADLTRVRTADSAASATALLALPSARRRNVLRAWIAHRGLPPPNAAQLRELEAAVLHAAPDASPCLRWPGVEVRRYRDAVHVTAPLPPPPGADTVLDWDPRGPLELPPGCGRLAPSRARVRLVLPSPRLRVSFRRGGERLRLRPNGPAHSIKKLFQDAGVPPWVRERMPFIYHEETLVGVADRWIAARPEDASLGREFGIVWISRLPGSAMEDVDGHSGQVG